MTDNNLETSFFLVLAAPKELRYKWRKLRAQKIIQSTASLPKLNRDEVAIRVNVSVPSALFERPELTVSIEVAGDFPRVEVDADMMDDMAGRVSEILGTPVHVTCDLPESEV